MKHKLILALLAGAALTPPLAAEPRSTLAPHETEARALLSAHGNAARGPGVRIWTSSGEVVRRGERMRVFYRTERDAYVTVLRVDTDGRLRVLYPVTPWEENYSRAGRTYSVYAQGRDAFVVNDDPGVGYIFAVASEEPFDYDAVTERDHWDFSRVSGGRIHADPYRSLEEIAVHMLPPDYYEFDTHLMPYHVERRYDYPRFVCYDCHTYTPYVSWDPYRVHCSSFTLVVWRDPYYYYPSYWYQRRYGGTRVVHSRPGVVIRDSRFVFKARGTEPAGVQYRDRRAAEPAGRTPPERSVRGADLGGVGTVPVPGRRSAEPGARQQAREPVVVGGGDRRRATDERREIPETRPGEPRRATQEPGTVVPGTTLPRTDLPAPGRRPVSRGTEAYVPREPAREDEGTGQRRGVSARDREGQPEPPRPAGAAIPKDQSGERRAAPARGQPRPEPQPEARPQSRPESRPEARPEARPVERPAERPRAGTATPRESGGSSTERSRPSTGSANSGSGRQAPATGSGGLVRRRP